MVLNMQTKRKITGKAKHCHRADLAAAWGLGADRGRAVRGADGKGGGSE
jgi:hypothetical protein